MPSLISELKEQVFDESISVSSLLRKALIIAKEHSDEANEKWITKELRGYPDKENVPTYRDISGRPIFRDHNTGWQYVYTHNLSDEYAKKISSFKFRSPIADLESNAKEDIVAITYHPIAEKLLIEAMGGSPGIPAIQFNGKQFQEVLNIVRDKLIEWIMAIPNPPEEVEAVEAAPVKQQPQYQPSGIRKYLSENKSWLFQGIGTESVKALVVVVLMVMSFVGGYYIRKPQPKTFQLSPEELKQRFDQLTEGHNARRLELTKAIIQQEHDLSEFSSNQLERQQAISSLKRQLEDEDNVFAKDLALMKSVLSPVPVTSP